jgi:hypothetical protein
MDFSRALAALIASSGKATSMSFLRGVMGWGLLVGSTRVRISQLVRTPLVLWFVDGCADHAEVSR